MSKKLSFLFLFLSLYLSAVNAQEKESDPRIVSIIESIIPDTVYANQLFLVYHTIQGNPKYLSPVKSKYKESIVHNLDSIAAPRWLFLKFFNYHEGNGPVDIRDLPDLDVQQYYLVNEFRAFNPGKATIPALIVELENRKIVTGEKEVVVLPSVEDAKHQFEVSCEINPSQITDCYEKFDLEITIEGDPYDLKSATVDLKKLEKYLKSNFEILLEHKQIAKLEVHLDRNKKPATENLNKYKWRLKPKKAMKVVLPSINIKLGKKKFTYPLKGFTVSECNPNAPNFSMSPHLDFYE